MSSRVLSGVLIILLGSIQGAPGEEQAGNLSGGVTIGTSGNWVYSPGVAQYRDGFGIIDWSVQLSGTHALNDTASGPWWSWSYTAWGDYQQQVAEQGFYDRCYRAALDATARRGVFTVASNTFASEMACTPTTPPPPPPGGVPTDDTPITECPSPLILDLDDNGFHLSGPLDPVSFDLVPGGALERITWTRAGEGDGFLALDRNGNGLIDDGSELFGDHTPLHNGQTAPYGFIPLAEFDSASLGGNGNWVIDPADEVFPSLRLWIDASHDGVAEPAELSALADWGISHIEFNYSLSWRRDEHGNLFRARSRAWRSDDAGHERPVQLYDVFFLVAE